MISPSAVRRLTKYLSCVQALHDRGVEWVSSQELADQLGVTSSTVRQDLTHVEFSGLSRRGYQTCGLLSVLSRMLGADSVWTMAVAGAGNLGRALVLHQEFARRGFRICLVFDSDPKKIGRKIGSLTVRDIRSLPSALRGRRADIGVIAVPASAAQKVADLFVVGGVRGVLNLTHAHILAPGRVAVAEVRIVASLQELAHAIQCQRLVTAGPRKANPSEKR